MNTEVIKTSTENVIDKAKAMSNNHVGNGKIKKTSIKTMPNASAISDRFASTENLTGDWAMGHRFP